jgi:hypothetical protein
VAHGDEAAVQLKDWAERNGRYVYFRMCDHTRKELDPPLGWSLSRHAEATIQGYLLDAPVPPPPTAKRSAPLQLPKPPSCRADNQKSAEQLREWLVGPAGHKT